MDDVINNQDLFVGASVAITDGILFDKDDSHTRQDLGHFICATASLQVNSTLSRTQEQSIIMSLSHLNVREESSH